MDFICLWFRPYLPVHPPFWLNRHPAPPTLIWPLHGTVRSAGVFLVADAAAGAAGRGLVRSAGATLRLLILSGLLPGASRLCYFRAL